MRHTSIYVHQSCLQETELRRCVILKAKICIENPVGYLNNNWKKPSQVIQPYYFGDTESKRTCLWLKNLEPLKHTKLVKPKIYGYYKSGKKKGMPIYKNDWQQWSEDRGKIRSKFFQGIADAMADQWGTDK